jgi:hypothetical protein
MLLPLPVEARAEAGGLLVRAHAARALGALEIRQRELRGSLRLRLRLRVAAAQRPGGCYCPFQGQGKQGAPKTHVRHWQGAACCHGGEEGTFGACMPPTASDRA